MVVAIITLIVITVIKFWHRDVKSIFYDDFTENVNEQALTLVLHGLVQSKNIPPLKHYTITWKNTAIWFDHKALEKEVLNNNLLLSVETWSKDSFFSSSTDNVLQKTLEGQFDSRIEALGRILSKTNKMVLVRWNPEMEVPVKKFPWQQQSPLLYIKAFQYFSLRLKKVAANAKIIWAPSGYPGDTEYFPGTNFVDLASITIKSVSEDSLPTGNPNTIPPEELLKQKLHRMRLLGKDVLVLVSKGTLLNNFQKSILQNVQSNIRSTEYTINSQDKNVNANSRMPLRAALNVGLYDPTERLVADPKVSVEHIFIDWGQIEDGTFEKKFAEITARKHRAIITLEPWRSQISGPDSNVLISLSNGRYDPQIKQLYAVLSKATSTVYLRFAHEMEIPIHRYAWQSQDPVTYINAYRYFMKFFDARAGNIRRVWGPAGDRGSIDFWPGDDVVDYISIAIYGLPDKNISDHRKQESFEDIFNRKIYRMRFLTKPIFITEFGVKGPESFQSAWLQAAAKVIKDNRFVFGVCYFNLYDNPKVWGKDMDAPDWSITKATFDAFCNDL